MIDQNIKIDKRCGNIAFNDEHHVYWNTKTKDVYKSVTQKIGALKQDFDTEGKSIASACRLLEIELPGYQKGKSFIDAMKQKYKDDPEIVEKVVTQARVIAKQWFDKNAIDCKIGTRCHAILEKDIKSQDSIMAEYLKLVEFIPRSVGSQPFKVVSDLKEFINSDYAIFPEALLANNEFKVAGQVDLLIKAHKNIIIVDHKTAEDFSRLDNNYYTMLKSPLSNVPQSKYMIYALQLKMYAVLLSTSIKAIDPNSDLLDPDSYTLKLNLITLDQSLKQDIEYLDTYKNHHKVKSEENKVRSRLIDNSKVIKVRDNLLSEALIILGMK